ncbi:MAG TPA: hypothetical protein VF599_07380 [Pyrinomonadaceae bacterium]|jgi:hypothetical protein
MKANNAKSSMLEKIINRQRLTDGNDPFLPASRKICPAAGY